jgi:DNA (cytosine-5)-methyltransferase 1
MLFNGLGRPLKIDGVSATLPASMGGNKTPIVDEDALYHNAKPWVESYHRGLTNGTIKPEFSSAPERLRRLTITEAKRLMTFPDSYVFCGPTTAIYRQIGNAVPPLLAQAVGGMAKTILNGTCPQKKQSGQGVLEL